MLLFKFWISTSFSVTRIANSMTENRTAELLIPTQNKCSIHSWILPFFLLAIFSSFDSLSFAEGKTLSAKHLLGFDHGQDSRIVIRNMEIVPPEPIIDGERFVLTTIGSEHENKGALEFHPCRRGGRGRRGRLDNNALEVDV